MSLAHACRMRFSLCVSHADRILVSAVVAPGGAPPPPPPPGRGTKRREFRMIFACGSQLTSMCVAHDDDEPDPPTPSKRVAAAALPCSRCVRRLTTPGGAAGTRVACEKLTPTGRPSVNCRHCQRGRRGGPRGCVPVCPHSFRMRYTR